MLFVCLVIFRLAIWVVLFVFSQWLGLFVIIKGGIECNDAINGGIDSLLHDWQLRFNTISWSGGFTKTNEQGEAVGYVVNDPPGETKEDIARKEEAGDPDYGSMEGPDIPLRSSTRQIITEQNRKKQRKIMKNQFGHKFPWYQKDHQ